MEKEISLEEVRHMANLSRLVITEEEEAVFAGQFARILGHMEVLRNVDTNGVEPLYSPAQGSAETRPDEAHESRGADVILANAPETDGEYFIVPRIV